MGEGDRKCQRVVSFGGGLACEIVRFAYDESASDDAQALLEIAAAFALASAQLGQDIGDVTALIEKLLPAAEAWLNDVAPEAAQNFDA